MTRREFILKEIRHRRLGFAASVLAVSAAVAVVTGAYTLLALHDRRTETILAEKQRAAEQETAKLEDEMRKITKRLGFNVLILPKDQNLADFYADDYAIKTMPEEYVERLAKSKIITIQHLLPTLQRRLKWPEKERTILLVGVRGEVPLAFGGEKEPILQPVPPGAIVLGSELHKSLGLKKGDTVQLMGRSFKVHQLNPDRGTKDDITAWINLREAQELLNMPGRINSIMALQCRCAWADLAKVRQEVGAILPDTQCIEFASQALTRAEARTRAAETAQAVVTQWKEHRAALRRQIESLAALLVPGIVALAMVIVAALSWLNARQRTAEIGILCALGLKQSDIILIFLGKAVLTGLAGVVPGLLLGFCAPMAWEGGASAVVPLSLIIGPVIATPLMTVLAAWLPAQAAASQDPAMVLQRDL
ncbi:MAG: hypothetical protein N2689_11870 [Verrucomicrobiae bacterium]|nr:hypothetical protein [Verrucomicrobiae bacterium]